MQAPKHQRPPSPPWKVRTRPCPFYSSGRCLFSSSCAFIHVVKSPLTPIDYASISEYTKSMQDTTYNTLNNGEYDPESDKGSSRDWSKGAKSTPPVTGTHSRGDSEYSYGNTTSPTETGTVRGHSISVASPDNPELDNKAFAEEKKIIGLGLSNMELMRNPEPQPPVPISHLVTPEPQLPTTDASSSAKPHLSVSDPPFAFIVKERGSPSDKMQHSVPMLERDLSPVDEKANSLVRRTISRSDSGGQEVEVKTNRPHAFLSLTNPGASSLIQNRVRKNTVSGQPPVLHLEPQSHPETPITDASGSPSVTLKRPSDAGIEHWFPTKPEPAPAPEPSALSPFLDTPPVEYEDESPSRARLRFQKAYQLVTKELRERVAHLRQSPATPETLDLGPALHTQVEPPNEGILGASREDLLQQAQEEPSKSPSYLDDYLGDESTEPALYEAKEIDIQRQEQDPAPSRTWLKPLRLSTLGSQIFSSNSQQSSSMHSAESNRSLGDIIPSTRSSSPAKRSPSPIRRPVSSAYSRKSSQNSRQNSQQNSRKNTVETFTPSMSMGSPPIDASAAQPVLPVFASAAVDQSKGQRSGSIPYIHSPSPSKWIPPSNQPRPEPFSNTPRSVSPTRAARPSLAPVDLARRMSMRPKSTTTSHFASTPPLPTEKPKLFFAIASNKPDEVAHLLATGQASPNETVGPDDLHALTFAIENMADGDPSRLPQMEEVVTTLLSYGANPNVLENATHKETSSGELKAGSNPLVNYFLEKAHRSPLPAQTSSSQSEDELPLRRAKFVIVGQEFGLQELARAYAAHIRLSRFLVEEEDDPELPFVSIFTGLSGHGKTLLASKVGRLLGIPTYTINTTLIKGYNDLWSAPSCHSRELNEHSSLRDFLHAYDRQRVVVVIDEIEKIHDPSLLQSLLVPWETGRLQEGVLSRTIDVSRTVWICTSNIGSQDIPRVIKEIGVLDSHSFDSLAKQARSHLREVLGASLVARVSTVIPFVPFSPEERLAISSKCLSALRHKLALSRTTVIPSVNFDGVLEKAAREYVEAEGARSIRRSILRLVDALLHDI